MLASRCLSYCRMKASDSAPSLPEGRQRSPDLHRLGVARLGGSSQSATNGHRLAELVVVIQVVLPGAQLTAADPQITPITQSVGHSQPRAMRPSDRSNMVGR